jgi:hypothetical protein
MVQGARTTEKGTRQAAGFLFPIARKRLTELTANDIREAYDAAVRKSQRRAAYAIQVLRAVLRWHGVVVADNPLGRETAGRDRITISASRGDPSPIPPELLGTWWRNGLHRPRCQRRLPQTTNWRTRPRGAVTALNQTTQICRTRGPSRATMNLRRPSPQ